MILGFSTELTQKPTYFVEKISAGLIDKMTCSDNRLFVINLKKHIYDYADFKKVKRVDAFKLIEQVNPKLHTIREDKNNRWKVGTKIDFFINCRQPTMFRFAPVLPVVSTQKIEINYFNKNNPKFTGQMSQIAKGRYNETQVCIDEKALNANVIEILAKNDGFDTVEDFFAYFNQDFTGKIIHWTDLKY